MIKQAAEQSWNVGISFEKRDLFIIHILSLVEKVCERSNRRERGSKQPL